MRNIETKKYFLRDVRRIKIGYLRAQIAVEQTAYHPDRLVIWTGRHDWPKRFWRQGTETRSEFIERVKYDI